MGYVNYDKYLREFERLEYEKQLKISKQLLEDYEDFKEVIVPAMKQYIALSINKDFKMTAQGLLMMCEISVVKLKTVCDNTEKVTCEELKNMNSNFKWCMGLIQKKYEHIVTKELPQFEDGEGYNI